jgi:hypothetical protein
MASRARAICGYVIGVLALAAAFFMARAFWGTFTAFYLWPKGGGVSGLIFHSFIGALVGSLPFGVLFGLVVSSRTAVNATLFAALAAGLLVAFIAWAGFLSGPTWWVAPLDALFFVPLFAIFATLATRFFPATSSHARTIAAAAFLLLAVFYYFGPQLYYSYLYAPKV